MSESIGRTLAEKESEVEATLRPFSPRYSTEGVCLLSAHFPDLTMEDLVDFMSASADSLQPALERVIRERVAAYRERRAAMNWCVFWDTVEGIFWVEKKAAKKALAKSEPAGATGGKP